MHDISVLHDVVLALDRHATSLLDSILRAVVDVVLILDHLSTYEAALDLGCKPGKALRKVILPQIMPGIVTGALLSFTMSLDDFVISYFTSNTDQNLSMIVYSAARRGIEPTIYALSTLMFLAVLVLLVDINKRSSLEDVS